MLPTDFLKPRAFFAALRNREQNLFDPLRACVIIVLLGSLIPAMFLNFQQAGSTWAFFRNSFLMGITTIAVLMGLVRLIAWSPAPIRAPEIVGYALSPVMYALVLFALVGYFVWPVGVGIMSLAAAWCAYFIWVGVDVMVGRVQAWRVLVCVPMLALVFMVVFVALTGQA